MLCTGQSTEQVQIDSSYCYHLEFLNLVKECGEEWHSVNQPPEISWWKNKSLDYMGSSAGRCEAHSGDSDRRPSRHLTWLTIHFTGEDARHRKGNDLFMFVNVLCLLAIDKREYCYLVKVKTVQTWVTGSQMPGNCWVEAEKRAIWGASTIFPKDEEVRTFGRVRPPKRRGILVLI